MNQSKSKMVEEEVPIPTKYLEDSPDCLESSNSSSDTDCRQNKHFIGPVNKIKYRFRRIVRNRRFLDTMLRCASSSSSDTDDTFTLPGSSTEDDSEESTSDRKSSTTENSNCSISHQCLISSSSNTGSTDNSTNSSRSSHSSSSSNIPSDSSSSNSDSNDSSARYTSMSESGCDSSEYETLDTEIDN